MRKSTGDVTDAASVCPTSTSRSTTIPVDRRADDRVIDVHRSLLQGGLRLDNCGLGLIDVGEAGVQIGVGLIGRDPRGVEIGLGNQVARRERGRAGQLRLRVLDRGPVSGDHGARLRDSRFSLVQRRLRRFVLCVVERGVETRDDVAGVHKRVVVDQQRLDDPGFLRSNLDRRDRLQRTGGHDATCHRTVSDIGRQYLYSRRPPENASGDRTCGDRQDDQRQAEPERARHDQYYDPHA
jgi:hypothetical protein